MKKLYIRFFENKDGIPVNSELVGTKHDHFTSLEDGLSGFITESISHWMLTHPEGKVDFVWL